MSWSVLPQSEPAGSEPAGSEPAGSEPAGSEPLRSKPARRNRSRWAISATLVVLLWAACATLSPLLAGVAWWGTVAIVALLVLGSATLLRQLRVPRPLVPVALVGVLLAAALLTVMRLTAMRLTVNDASRDLLAMTPSGIVDTARQLFTAGVNSIEAQTVPAVADAGILFLLALGVGFIAILMDLLANTLRVPALAGLVVLIPVSVTGLVLQSRTKWWFLVLTAALYVLLLAVGAAERRVALGQGSPLRGRLQVVVLTGAFSLVSALILTLLTPPPGAGVFAQGQVGAELFGSGVSPLITLGQDLRRPGAQRALTYQTTSSRPLKLTLLTIDTFDGQTWGGDVEPPEPANTVDDIQRPAGLSAQVKTVETTTRIVIDNVRTPWLPAPKPATRVVGLTGEWTWSSDNRAISSESTTTLGQRYTVTGLEPEPTVDQLASSLRGPYGAGLSSSLALPEKMPAVIAATAAEVTDGVQTPYDQAVALQEYLRSGNFRYDTEAPVENGYDGSGMDVIATFLEQKRGYCIHFASAMTVMARTLGIPARVAIGYLPGQRNAAPSPAPSTTSTGDPAATSAAEPAGAAVWARYTVSSHDLHAWPELYFVDIGWVPFEPTLSRGVVPGYSRPAAVTALPGASRDARNDQTSEPGSTPTSAPEGQLAATNAPAVQNIELALPDGVPLGWTLAGILLLLLPVMPVLRFRRRDRRLRGVGLGDDFAAWAELVATVQDYALPALPTETPRELATRLQLYIGRTMHAEPASGPAPEQARSLHSRQVRSLHSRQVRSLHSQQALSRLLLAAEVSRFARVGGSSRPAAHGAGGTLVDDVRQVRRAIRDASAPLARLRAFFWPRSLWGGRPDSASFGAGS